MKLDPIVGRYAHIGRHRIYFEEAGNGEYWTEFIKAYEATHPNVKIKKQPVPFREYIDKLTVRFAGNNPPDIVHLPTRNYLAFASQGWLAPLDDFLAGSDPAGDSSEDLARRLSERSGVSVIVPAVTR